MHRMHVWVWSGLFVLLASCATPPSSRESSSTATTRTTATATTEMDPRRKALQDAFASLAKEDFATADRLLTAVIDAPGFSGLTTAERYAALYVAGVAAGKSGDPERGYEYLKRATALDKADGKAWAARAQVAYTRTAIDDAISSLTIVARRWPESLPLVDDLLVFRLARHAKRSTAGTQAYFGLLDALYAAGWKSPSGREPASLWCELTLLLLERGQTDRARQVAARVNGTYSLIGMRVDNRFEPVRKAAPERFDIDKAAAKEIGTLRESVQRSPRSMEALLDLTEALLMARQYDEVLKLTYQTSTRTLSATRNAAPFDDADRYLIWVMDQRARAYAGLNRQEEAADELLRARRFEEQGAKNVSQSINLAYRYTVMGRSKDALDSLAEMGTNITSYGAMQVEAVKLAAAVQLKNAAEVDRALSYLREHRTDAPATFLWALVKADRLDEAADWLITRLDDPRERLSALLDIQQYAEPPATPAQAEWRGRWKQLIQREDVQATVAKVGRIEAFNVVEEGGG